MNTTVVCIIYTGIDGNAVLMDIPTSISRSCPRRLLSVKPLEKPYVLPEPKDPSVVFNQELLDIHNEIREAIIRALNSLRTGHRGPWCLSRRTRVISDDNPLPPFLTADFKANLALLQIPPDQDPLDIAQLNTGNCLDIADICGGVVCNSSNIYQSMNITATADGKEVFIIPPKSSFLLAPFQDSIDAFTAHANRIGLFNFVLLDPPWPNRSAERCKATYDTLPNIKDLLRIPLENCLRPEAIVGVWVTNKPKWRRFVLDRLFPKWGLVYAGEWIWLKVTNSGEPIFDLESVMRKPYEMVLFGRKKTRHLSPNGNGRKWRRGEQGIHLPSPELEMESGPTMPTKVIAAVPDLHSRKPCLKDLIKSYVPMNYTACEIFGRHLVEDWFTWGDEAIRFNASEHWAEI